MVKAILQYTAQSNSAIQRAHAGRGLPELLRCRAAGEVLPDGPAGLEAADAAHVEQAGHLGQPSHHRWRDSAECERLPAGHYLGRRSRSRRRQHRLGHVAQERWRQPGGAPPIVERGQPGLGTVWIRTATTWSGALRSATTSRGAPLGDDNIVGHRLRRWRLRQPGVGNSIAGDNLVWGTSLSADNLVWGTAALGDNLVWERAGTSTTSSGERQRRGRQHDLGHFGEDAPMFDDPIAPPVNFDQSGSTACSESRSLRCLFRNRTSSHNGNCHRQGGGHLGRPLIMEKMPYRDGEQLDVHAALAGSYGTATSSDWSRRCRC